MSVAPEDPAPSTIERLREVAAELFAERGYSGASLAEITSRVGIRKPSVYNYYPSKDELFLDLLKASFEAWSAASDPCLEPPGSHRQRLRRHLQAAVDFAVHSPHAMALCRVAASHVGGDLESRVAEQVARHCEPYERRLAEFFAEAQAAGEVRHAPVDVLVLAWLTFVDGVLTNHVFDLGQRRHRYHQHLEGLWQLFWHGMAAEGERP